MALKVVVGMHSSGIDGSRDLVLRCFSRNNYVVATSASVPDLLNSTWFHCQRLEAKIYWRASFVFHALILIQISPFLVRLDRLVVLRRNKESIISIKRS